METGVTPLPFLSASRVLFRLALAVLAAGCGLDPSLGTAADEAALSGPVAKGSTKITSTTSTTLTTPPLASPTDGSTAPTYENSSGRTVSGNIGANGGVLRMKEVGTAEKKDLIVEFTVPKGALDQTCPVTMTVYGNTLSELVVAFQPGGLRFITSAQLMVKVGFNRVDSSSDALIVWHIYDDGTVEQATLTGTKDTSSSHLSIFVQVDGFSRYGLRG